MKKYEKLFDKYGIDSNKCYFDKKVIRGVHFSRGVYDFNGESRDKVLKMNGVDHIMKFDGDIYFLVGNENSHESSWSAFARHNVWSDGVISLMISGDVLEGKKSYDFLKDVDFSVEYGVLKDTIKGLFEGKSFEEVLSIVK